MVKNSKDFELVVEENVVVRTMYVGSEFDDMGNIKQYTKEQIAKLRGNDPSKPGYAARIEDILPGQEVALYLTPVKNAGKKKDDEAGERPTVRMIVLTREQGGISAGPERKGKK
jgi:hypothetical protein